MGSYVAHEWPVFIWYSRSTRELGEVTERSVNCRSSFNSSSIGWFVPCPTLVQCYPDRWSPVVRKTANCPWTHTELITRNSMLICFSNSPGLFIQVGWHDYSLAQRGFHRCPIVLLLGWTPLPWPVRANSTLPEGPHRYFFR